MVFAAGDGDHTFRAATIGHLFVDMRRHARGGKRARIVERVEDIELADFVAAGNAVLNLALAFDHEETFLTAQR